PATGIPDFRVFNITGSSVRISGLMISNGRAASGGGINYQPSGLGRLVLEGCTVSNNVATASGGGINNSFGTLSLSNITIIANTALGAGANSAAGGVISNLRGTIEALNSCIIR